MPKFKTAQEAFDAYNQGGGGYGGGWNNPSHFESEDAWSEFKHMVPQADKKAFRQKVAGNESRAIEGLSQGLTREQMGIRDVKDGGQALYRRLGSGLGTGLDMGRAYNWGSGTALNVGTSDLAKRGIESRGITGDERQRYADFSAAGSPEAYWSGYRQNQIKDLLDKGAIERDPTTGGYRNPGAPGGGQYGRNLEGYNLGQNPLGHGRGTGGASVAGGGYTPQTISGDVRAQGGGAPAAPAFSPSAFPTSGYGSGQAQNAPQNAPQSGGFSYNPGAPTSMNSEWQALGKSLAGGSAGAPVAFQGGAGAPTPTPTGGVAPPFGASPSPAAPGRPVSDKGPGGVIYERPPGTVGPFGAPGTGNPSGNALFPPLTPPGSGGAMDPSTGSGGGQVPGWRPEGNLPGVPVTQGGLPPNMAGFEQFMSTPFGQQLMGMGQGDQSIQDFNLMRALAEYEKSQGYEGVLGQHFGDILGYDLATGKPLEGQAADVANARSFGAMAPQVGRIMSDTDALQQRLRREAPEGGEKTAASADLLRAAQGQIGGLRQGQYSQALQGVGDLAMAAKSFDPGAYTGGAQSLLGAYGQGRGQDIGAYGQSLDALLSQRGQDVQWGLGQGNLGLGWAGLGQQGAQNAWNNYLQGRGQDIGLYSTTRGQDLDRLSQQEAIRQQQRGQNQSFWGSLASGLGGLLGGIFSDRGAKTDPRGFSDGLSTLGGFWQASDVTAKDDVEPHKLGLDAVKMLQPYSYTYNDRVPALAGTRAVGFMAQDVEKVDPAAVGEMEIASGTLKTLAPMRIMASLVNAVKELDAKMDGLAGYGKKGKK